MSTIADELTRRAERGERIRSIREAMGLTGEQFAAELNRAMRSYGVKDQTLDEPKVSRLERGGRRITAEEIAVLVQLDPKDRGVQWLVFGGPPVARARKVG